jgi:alanine racemase
MDPFQHDPAEWGLRPALRLTSYVAVKDCQPGESVGYGRGFVAEDTIELIGPHLSAEAMGADLETINYEIACGLSARVRRVYANGT